LHLSADRIRFRKTDVPSINWNRFKRNKVATRTSNGTAAATSAENGTKARRVYDAPSGASSVAASEATVDSNKPPAAAQPQPSFESASSAAAERHPHTDPAPPALSFEEAVAGLTKRQARFLHTNLTPSNILPASRRSAGRPTRLPWERVDWKGRMKEE
jgi:hypothetical protein